MIQQVLASPSYFDKMAPEDFRALSALIYHHINPYGIFELDLHERARNFLSDGEMDALLEASKKGRHGVRDFLLLLIRMKDLSWLKTSREGKKKYRYPNQPVLTMGGYRPPNPP